MVYAGFRVVPTRPGNHTPGADRKTIMRRWTKDRKTGQLTGSTPLPVAPKPLPGKPGTPAPTNVTVKPTPITTVMAVAAVNPAAEYTYRHIEDLTGGTVLIGAVVGSTAYGLAHAGSDEDRLGVFAAPTNALLGLDTVQESHVWHEPSDVTFHEVGKYVRLALAGNPTITELLWHPNPERVNDAGQTLIDLRSAFLSKDKIRAAYLGYAIQQFEKLKKRGDGAFDSDTRARAPKHARHMARLMDQGYQLYTTGELSIQVDNPEWYIEFSNAGPERWLSWFEAERHRFDNAPSALPDEPDRERVNNYLIELRRSML